MTESGSAKKCCTTRLAATGLGNMMRATAGHSVCRYGARVRIIVPYFASHLAFQHSTHTAFFSEVTR
jgi:hypothetical protein